MRISTHCNTLQHTASHTATHCNTLQRTAIHCTTRCNTLQHQMSSELTLENIYILQNTATHCNTLHHTATHCNTLHHTLHHTATHCNTRQHTATHFRIPVVFAVASLWLIVASFGFSECAGGFRSACVLHVCCSLLQRICGRIIVV